MDANQWVVNGSSKQSEMLMEKLRGIRLDLWQKGTLKGKALITKKLFR